MFQMVEKPEIITMPQSTKLALWFEKVTIVTFVVGIIILAILDIVILNKNDQVLFLFSYFFMNGRLVFKGYIVDIILSPVTQPATDCPSGYYKFEFSTLENIYHAKLNDVTEETKILNTLSKSGELKNLTFVKEKYYKFNIREKPDKGGVDFPLMNKYSLNNWKGTNFCILKLYLDEWFQGMQIISSKYTCAEYFLDKANDTLMDCGTYGQPSYLAKEDLKERYFRLCILKDKVFTDPELTDQLYGTKDKNYQNINLCPVQNFDFDFYTNTHFNDSDVNSWGNIYTSMTWKNNSQYKQAGNYNMTLFDIRSNPLLGSLPLFVNFDNSYYQLNQDYPKPQDLYVFGKYDEATLLPGQNYGLTDLISIDLDYYNFFQVYNDTFYDKKVWDKNTKTYSYEPEFIVNRNQKEFIMPEKASSIDYTITLTKKMLPMFSRECFEGVFENNQITDFIYFLTKLNILFIDEFVASSISICLMLALVAFYCELYIRFYIINRLIDNDVNDYDWDSEKITKYIHKFFEFVLLFIAIFYQIYIIGTINLGTWVAQQLLDFNCFKLNNPKPGEHPDVYAQQINNQFIFYIEFLKELNNIMIAYLVILMLIMVCHLLVLISYQIVSYSEKDLPLTTEQKEELEKSNALEIVGKEIEMKKIK